MPSQSKEFHHRPWCLKAHLGFIALLVGWISGVSAQTVYRCGDQYNANAQCGKAMAQTLQDPRNAAQDNAQQGLTRQTQKEADALEKNRISAERQAATSTMRLSTFPQDNALTPSKVAPESIDSTSSRGKRHTASPYFTAKDGSASKKTKKKTSAGQGSPASITP